MGCWGVKPYENDGAADWFEDLWNQLPVPQKVEETLKLDIQDSHEEIRAAAYVLLQLGETYSWPVGDIDRHCELAATRLEELIESEIYEGEEFQTQIKQEIAALRSRISRREKE
jgi:hypothetical protein